MAQPPVSDEPEPDATPSQRPTVDDIRRGAQELGEERERLQREARRRLEESRQLYSIDGQPALLPSAVAYLDALGTSDAIAELDDDELRQQIKDLDDLRWFLYDEGWDREVARLLSFTDNVVVAEPLTRDRPGGFGLGVFLPSVAYYQLNMAIRGRPLRGGVDIGTAYVDGTLATGEALLGAVNIEKDVARFPRVVLSEDAVHLVWLSIHDEYGSAPESSPWNSQLLIDGDGEVFLNYLDGLTDDGHPADVFRGMTLHREMIEAALAEHSDKPGVREKYVWLAQYHDFMANTWLGLPEATVRAELDIAEASRKFTTLAEA